MLPGAPGYTEIQLLGMPFSAPKHSEDMFIKQVVSLGYLLPVQIREVTLISTERKHQYIGIRDLAEHLLQVYPDKLLAGKTVEAKDEFHQNMLDFWRAFKLRMPQHDVFERFGDELKNCLPIKVHCDEGTGVRKNPILQVTWGPILSSDPSSLSRYFFFTSMLGDDYKHFHRGYELGNSVIDELFDVMAAELSSVYLDGVVARGIGRLRLVFVGLEGDLPAQARVYHLKRNFNCTPNSMCAYCMADDRHIPYTDVKPTAAWRNTLYTERPWTTPCPLVSVPGTNHEMIIAKDLFHLCHLGAVRGFVINVLCYMTSIDTFVTCFCIMWGTCIFFYLRVRFMKNLVAWSSTILISKSYKIDHAKSIEAGTNIPAKLSSAYSEFRSFCRDRKFYPHVKHFTRENLGWTSSRKFPECSFKGSDCRILLAFIIHVLEKPETTIDEIAESSYVAAKSIDDFLRLVFGNRDDEGCRAALLDRATGSRAALLLKLYLEKFMDCAKAAYGQQLCFFNLTPKYHYLMHVLMDMDEDLSSCGHNACILSPALFATQMAEDAVGRSSRFSRHCHVRTTALRVVQRWLIACKVHWDPA